MHSHKSDKKRHASNKLFVCQGHDVYVALLDIFIFLHILKCLITKLVGQQCQENQNQKHRQFQQNHQEYLLCRKLR